jgi:DNA gyrase subunit A
MSDDLPTPPPPPTPPGGGAGELIPINIEDEMRRSYLDYSMSVIVGRALPDVRDGLKPVHRRILYAMQDEGLLHNRKYSKCAGVVGEVLKKYHPHGDASVYDALVRLAQPWNMRYLLVDGQGNFGSVDGDSAAAYRYTECRHDRARRGDARRHRQGDRRLRAQLRRLHQGAAGPPHPLPEPPGERELGIAVGMTTNIPPHNMREVIDGTLHLIDHPKATVRELMQHIPGPDFPTHGFILGREGIQRAYETGRGQITLRARHEIETAAKGERESIVISRFRTRSTRPGSPRRSPSWCGTRRSRASVRSATSRIAAACVSSSS